MGKKEFNLINNTREICKEVCPTKDYYNYLSLPHIDMSAFLDMFYAPFEASTDLLNVIKILFIGEAPSEKDTINGRPFYPYTPTGEILREAIKDLKIEHYAIANIINCRPVYKIGNKLKNRTPAYNECQYCSSYLKDFILSLNKNLKVVLLGKTAAFTILGETDYTKKSTTITHLVNLAPYNYKGRTYGVAHHPRYVNSGGGIKSQRYKDYLVRMREVLDV